MTSATGPLAAPRDNVAGAAWMLFSVVSASAMTIAARVLAEDMDSRMIVFLRAVVTLAALAPFLPLPALRRKLRFTKLRLHLFRGALIGVSTHLGFYAIATLPLATAAVLFFTAPIFATLLAGPINGERVGPRRWAAVIAGFAGAVVILRPGFGAGMETLEPGMIAALGSSLLFALALAQSREVADADGPFAAYLSSVVVTAVVSVPAALPVWSLPADGAALIALAVLVASGAARGIADIQAYRIGEASVMGVVAYLRLVVLGVAGWLMFAEVPDGATWIGGGIIVGATLYIARREAAARRSRPAAGRKT